MIERIISKQDVKLLNLINNHQPNTVMKEALAIVALIIILGGTMVYFMARYATPNKIDVKCIDGYITLLYRNGIPKQKLEREGIAVKCQ